MVPNETPKAPTYAEIEPPPGAIDSAAVSSAKSLTVNQSVFLIVFKQIFNNFSFD